MAVAFRSLNKGPPKSIRENINRFGPFNVNWYTLFRKCYQRWFTICRWCRERRGIGYWFHYFSGTTPHQLSVSSSWVKRMRHRSQHKRFLDATNYQTASVTIKKNFVCFSEYDISTLSYNTIRLLKECIGKSYFNIW